MSSTSRQSNNASIVRTSSRSSSRQRGDTEIQTDTVDDSRDCDDNVEGSKSGSRRREQRTYSKSPMNREVSEEDEREGLEEDEPVRESRWKSRRRTNASPKPVRKVSTVSFPAGPIDPFEAPSREKNEASDGQPVSTPGATAEGDTLLSPRDMAKRDDDMARLRLLAGKLSADWKGHDFMAPALARRLRDFQFAQEKRRRKYGSERPWGILGVYEHLSSIRVDVEWADDSARRRANGEPYFSWADFEASKKKGLNRPFFTYFLLVTCTVILITSIAMNGWKVETLDVNAMIGPSAQTLLKMGAKDSYLIVHENEVWRLVSSIVLHAGLVHYLINMLALWFVGSAIEMTHGFVAASILFIIPAIGGTIISAIFLPEYITVGASGGIFGLIGACLSDILMNWKLLFSNFVTEDRKRSKHAMVVSFLVLDIVLNTIIGLTPFVDNFTHLGGMAMGFLCGLSTMERVSSDFFGVEQSLFSRVKQVLVRFVGVIVSVIGIIVAMIVLLEGDGQTTPCPNCTWLSCVPFPPWKGHDEKWWYCDDCGRVIAEIVSSPSLHLNLTCPDGTMVQVPLDIGDDEKRSELEKRLPNYCREYCSVTDVRN